jgi:signal transduction histidine kinase
VSHDLRAPLRAMNGFSHLLEEEYAHRLDQNGLNYLGRIRDASKRMGELIDNLLDLARVGRHELSRTPVNLSAQAGEIRAALEEQAPERKVDWQIAPDLVVNGDPVLLKALLDNLLRNAWKFTAENPNARIEFSLCSMGGGKAFCVKDNGAGFEMAYADKLFKPFQRLHDVKRFEGTGIGLAIVHRIVRRHGGRIWADASPGKGAAFRFTLP